MTSKAHPHTRLLALLILASSLAAGCTGSRPNDASVFGVPPETDFDAAANRPPTARTLYELARVLVARDKDPEAQHVLRTCIRRNPRYRPAYVELAGLHVRHRRWDAAVAVLQEGLQFAPNDAILRNDLGMCWFLKSDFTSAHAEFEAASRAAPDDLRFRANVALAAAMLGRYEEALDTYRRVVPLDQAHYNLAVACEARGDDERAALEFAAAMGMGHPDQEPEPSSR